jgi:hypothetical protein
MSNIQLSDTQLAILAQAAARETLRILPAPETISAKGGALDNVLASLLRRGLAEEIPAGRDDAVWRQDEGGRCLTMRISNAGLEALQIELPSRETEPLELRCEQDPYQAEPAEPYEAEPTTPCETESPKPNGNAPAAPSSGSKGLAILTLLRREQGATIEELMAATGWQAHSVRGFISANLKKKLGLTVLSEKAEDGIRRYRIAAKVEGHGR